MKRIASVALVAILALTLGACSFLSTTTPPSAQQVQQIQLACAVDAGVRPSVTALMVFATPAEVAAITAARGVIDPICANPSATLQSDAISGFTAATAQIVAFEAALQARKAAPPK